MKKLKEIFAPIGSILGAMLMITGIINGNNEILNQGFLMVILCEIIDINNKMDKE